MPHIHRPARGPDLDIAEEPELHPHADPSVAGDPAAGTQRLTSRFTAHSIIAYGWPCTVVFVAARLQSRALQNKETVMANIGPVNMTVTAGVGNHTFTYQLTGDAFDVTSGQPYDEVCKLIGVDLPS